MNKEEKTPTYGDLYAENFRLTHNNRVLQQRIDKALTKINNMFNNGDEDTIIDDLLELNKILKGE